MQVLLENARGVLHGQLVPRKGHHLAAQLEVQVVQRRARQLLKNQLHNRSQHWHVLRGHIVSHCQADFLWLRGRRPFRIHAFITANNT